MKAWRVQDKRDYTYCTVVFAETPASAKTVAKSTEFGKNLDWIDIRVTRAPKLDREYRGHVEMDWDDDQDRLALVMAGFGCDEVNVEECESCVGRKECKAYGEYAGVAMGLGA